jgi:hypothetical protein
VRRFLIPLAVLLPLLALAAAPRHKVLSWSRGDPARPELEVYEVDGGKSELVIHGDFHLVFERQRTTVPKVSAEPPPPLSIEDWRKQQRARKADGGVGR